MYHRERKRVSYGTRNDIYQRMGKQYNLPPPVLCCTMSTLFFLSQGCCRRNNIKVAYPIHSLYIFYIFLVESLDSPLNDLTSSHRRHELDFFPFEEDPIKKRKVVCVPFNSNDDSILQRESQEFFLKNWFVFWNSWRHLVKKRALRGWLIRPNDMCVLFFLSSLLKVVSTLIFFHLFRCQLICYQIYSFLFHS